MLSTLLKTSRRNRDRCEDPINTTCSKSIDLATAISPANEKHLASVVQSWNEAKETPTCPLPQSASMDETVGPSTAALTFWVSKLLRSTPQSKLLLLHVSHRTNREVATPTSFSPSACGFSSLAAVTHRRSWENNFVVGSSRMKLTLPRGTSVSPSKPLPLTSAMTTQQEAVRAKQLLSRGRVRDDLGSSWATHVCPRARTDDSAS